LSDDSLILLLMLMTMFALSKECCFGYNTPASTVRYWGFGIYLQDWWTGCKLEGSHVSVRASTVNGTEDDLFDDNTNADPANAVDVLWGPEPTLSADELALCIFCNMHASCSDNEVPGANLTMFNLCTDHECCSLSVE